MAKVGRPKAENPRIYRVGVRLREDEIKKLKEYASKHNMTLAQVLQKGIELQYLMD